jgi:hypothetical protein
MDTQTLIKEAKARFQHQESKNYLKEKYTADLNFTEQGGLWTASPEFITFLRTTSSREVIFLDNYGKPVQVDVQKLLEVAEDIYTSTMQSWYNEFQELKTKR